MDALDKDIIRCIQRELPVGQTPFRAIAEELHITEEVLLKRIEALTQQGIIRRVGAILNHRHVGFVANAMVVWSVPEERMEQIGTFFAGQREISHCYQRESYADWPYSLYTMVHARTAQECDNIIAGFAEAVGITDYEVLYSTTELKKASYVYFS